MPQDQLFKELLQAFFREFLELFYPDIAARLDFAQVTFLDKEAFTDVPDGSRREADLVAQVHTKEGEPELVLVHVEVQTQRRKEVPYRMFEYYALLRLRHRQPVLPVVVYLAPGTGGLVRETYTETLFGEDLLTFRYNAVGLPDLPARDYLERNNPLAPALSALMRLEGMSRVLRRIASMRQKPLLQADDARRSLLLSVIDRYLPLSNAEQQEFEQLTADPELLEVNQMITSYEQRGLEKGIEQGIEQGILRASRRSVLSLARLRFQTLPAEFVTRVENEQDAARLETLQEQIVLSDSLASALQNAGYEV